MFAAATLLGLGASAQDGPPIPAALDIQTIERDGISIEFQATPVDPGGSGELVEAEYANIRFSIASAADGEPLRGTYPGVWIDLVQTADGQQKGTALECRRRVSSYLQGAVGMRPLIDLNSYYVLVLNQDASISVIDPVVGITGITSLLTSIPLERPGADWAKTQDEGLMFVSMPRAGRLAVVDLATFKVERNIDVGASPMRVAVQPDQRNVWVGNNVEGDADGGVTVIDIASRQVVARLTTGKGHHEIAFTEDSTRAFVTNRESGTVTLIDTATLSPITEIRAGWVPLGVGFSSLSGNAYLVDGASGLVAAIDPQTGERLAAIETKPGIGPIRFSYDGRWGFVANPEENEVYVIDAATNTLTRTVPIGDRPFQLAISETFAYVRSLDTERVSMINIAELTRGGEVVVNNFAAGSFPPGQVEDIRIAAGMVQAAQEAAMLVVSPTDATVYYYMEGMNAPMGAFRNYGHKPRAVAIANRALKELQPGVYTASVKLPLAGTFEVAFLNEAPRILHCFTMQAAINPAVRRAVEPIDVEYLSDHRPLTEGESMTLRFRLYAPGSGKTIEDAGDVLVKYYRAPRFDLTELVAHSVGDGIYEAVLPFRSAGSYYVYVAAPQLNVGYQDLHFRTVVVGKGRTAANLAR